MRAAGVLVLLAVCGYAMCGCASRPPPTKHYDLLGPTTAARLAATGAPAVAIERFTAAAPYDNDQIALRTSDVRLEQYRYHQWISPAPELVTELFASRWRASGRFSRVEIDGLGGDVSLTVSGRVQTLELDARPSPAVARVAIELTARDADGQVVYHRLHTRAEPIARRTVDAVVAAIRHSLDAIAADTAAAMAAAARR